MYIVKLIGGLGNQMFQYAAAFIAAKHNNQKLKVDAFYFKDKSKRLHRFCYRPYALSLFKNIEIATPKEINKFVQPRIYNKYIFHLLNIIHPKRYVYSDNILDTYEKLINIPKEMAYFDGFFQKYEYFEKHIDDLRKIFIFKEELPKTHDEMANLIRESINSICVVFRRGDYVGHPSLDVVDLDFYYRALEILPNGRIFAFSDDLNWVERNFKPSNHEVVYVPQKLTGPLGGNYLQLMMMCDNFVIPNSTYPYWAALLADHNPNKIVVAPNLWFKQQEPHTRNNIWPDDWICIDVRVNS